jgi:methyl-accepting chemotaxis protein
MLLAAATAAAIPTAALAQTAAAPRPADPPSAIDSLTPQDREALAAADQLAADVAQVLDQWITTQAITENRLFARLYFPILKTNPQKYTTPYDALADRDIVGVEDRAFARSHSFHYAILTDINAYVPTYNTRFAQPLTGTMEKDYVNNRTKRMLPDPASLAAARSESRFLLQRARLETGDVIYDMSVPVTVRGKHWGCVRIGYRRTE